MSERDIRTLVQFGCKYEDPLILNVQDYETTIHEFCQNNLSIQMPPLPPSPIPMTKEWREQRKLEKEQSVVIMAAHAMTNNDNNNHGRYQSRRHTTDNHDNTMKVFSQINSTQRIERALDRPMKEVQINYMQDQQMPGGLLGSSSTRILQERKRKMLEREERNNRAVPSVSTYRRQAVTNEYSRSNREFIVEKPNQWQRFPDQGSQRGEETPERRESNERRGMDPPDPSDPSDSDPDNRGPPRHWGQGVNYLVGTWRVHCDF